MVAQRAKKKEAAAEKARAAEAAEAAEVERAQAVAMEVEAARAAEVEATKAAEAEAAQAAEAEAEHARAMAEVEAEAMELAQSHFNAAKVRHREVYEGARTAVFASNICEYYVVRSSTSRCPRCASHLSPQRRAVLCSNHQRPPLRTDTPIFTWMRRLCCVRSLDWLTRRRGRDERLRKRSYG